MFAYLETALTELAHSMPLPLYTIIASAVEEVIAPIPSPFVMLVAGSLAAVQQYTYGGLLLLALSGALGKTIGAFGVYTVVKSVEHLALPRLERYFGVTESQIAALSARLGHGIRDFVILTLLRAFPFMPSVVVSVGSGIIQVPRFLFITTTFVGTCIRDSIYLYAGFAGAELITTYIGHAERAADVIQIVALVCFVLVLIVLYRRRASKR